MHSFGCIAYGSAVQCVKLVIGIREGCTGGGGVLGNVNFSSDHEV